MDDRALWMLVIEARAALDPHLAPALDRFAAEMDLPTWGLLLAALTFEPEPISATRLGVRGPYTAAGRYAQRLASAEEQGYLYEEMPGEYRLTDAGRAINQQFIDAIRAAMIDADPLPPADSRRLAELLGRLAQASLDTPPPPDTWSIRLSVKLMPAIEPPLPYIEQAISCLVAYRDDAHLAAWRPSGLSAPALEALTFIWRDAVSALDALCERLAHRGHPAEVYAGALAELRERGYLAGSQGAFALADAGRRFREAVEAETDRYFFAPWAHLSDAEKAEMAGLLTRLRDGLQPAP